ncbi:MAG: hypothetical protein IPK82_22660 [Polyangiaceae bacterium]|nr:hypothetical protein [Polyangiaceae bacterium]
MAMPPLSVGERYAASFNVAPPTSSATLLNFSDAETKALFDQMVSSKWSVLYSGTATFKGTECTTSDETYDYSKLPTTVNFVFGFASPTTYVNCQNQENQGDPFDGEEYQRGVTIQENQASIAQLTLHLEHAFYSETQHEPALYFDQLAALLVGQPEGSVLTLDLAKSVDPSAFTDGEGTPLPWRSCDGSTIPDAKQRSFDTGSVPLDPGGNPQSALRDYYDYIHYVQSSQGHLNGGEGLCYIQRNYPSPD